jgi:trehalose/maltose hydrolase-like predicted phosphorylase
LAFFRINNSNNPYFATGAGAMLQAVIYGFGGVEQTDNGLKFNKGLLPTSGSL